MSDYSEGTGVQYHLKTKKGDIGKYCILPGDPGRVSKIAEHLEDAHLVAQNREFTSYTGTLLGEKVSVVSTGIGGPSAAICMEELVKCGADTFIRVGTAGGINLKVKAGDVVIASACVRAEGTAREYADIEYPAVSDIDILFALKEASENLKYDNHVGVVQCKDSFYGQHEPEKMPTAEKLLSKWSQYCKLGCLASEMESATLFIVAQYLGVRAGTVLNIVGNQEREKRALPNKFVHDTNRAILTAIEALKILIQKDKKGTSSTNKSHK